MDDQEIGSRRTDEKGRTLEKIQAFMEVGVNPLTRRMQVKLIDCWKVIAEPKENGQ